MTHEEHLLLILAEECAEVAHRVSKALRFGLREVQEGQTLDNAERIAGELDDLEAVLRVLRVAGILRHPSEEAMLAKIAKMERFMIYADSLGMIQKAT